MKIRTDFVTNSSSSSFILGFTSEDKITEELVNGFPEHHMDKIKTVLKDVCDAERFDKGEAIKKIREEMRWEAEWDAENEYRRETRCSYCDAYDYMQTEDGIARKEERLNKIVDDAVTDMEGKSVFVEVEYGDEDGSYYGDLEHEVMPDVGSTIIRLSHH